MSYGLEKMLRSNLANALLGKRVVERAVEKGEQQRHVSEEDVRSAGG